MIPYQRHDLVWLSDAGKDHALRNIQNCIPSVNEREKTELILSVPPIPAIVRRQETPEDGMLCVGFSSPRIIDGVRLRIGCKVPLDCVIEHKTPFDVVKCEAKDVSVYGKIRCKKRELLEVFVDAGNRHHIQVGCFGSAALQMATGLPYWQEKSDLDIYLRRQGTRHELDQFFQQLIEYEERFGVTIGAEIEFPGQYGVKLKELYGPGKTVLGKGLYDVRLLEKGNFPEL